MRIKGIADVAGSCIEQKSSARISTLLHQLLIASRQQLTDILHLFTVIKCLLFIISAQQCNLSWAQMFAVTQQVFGVGVT